jgi:LPPG:FO 2-phospho-L-lactate transferase
LKIVALAGGVGGAKFADGLNQCLRPEDLTIIVNTGDDFDHFGLRICPDLDTVCYTLGHLSNPETGWGRDQETWRVLSALEKIGAPTWFRIGDLDLATHLERTRKLQGNTSLSQITDDFCRSWKIGPKVLPMSNDPVVTMVQTKEFGELPFQEYFVKRHCEPIVTGFHFKGIETAKPAPGVLESLRDADAILFCPSNPWVSIGPILALENVSGILEKKKAIAISPLIGGKAVKGPAAKMYEELGIKPSSLAVANQYRSLIKGFVLDWADESDMNEIAQWGIISLVTDIFMSSLDDRQRLAKEVLAFCNKL